MGEIVNLVAHIGAFDIIDFLDPCCNGTARVREIIIDGSTYSHHRVDQNMLKRATKACPVFVFSFIVEGYDYAAYTDFNGCIGSQGRNRRFLQLVCSYLAKTTRQATRDFRKALQDRFFSLSSVQPAATWVHLGNLQ